MNLLVFGLGYTASYFVRHFRGRFSHVCATVRTPGKVSAFNPPDVRMCQFADEGYDPAILDEITRADAILVSIPPAAGTDPVLEQFAEAIRSAPRLRWTGYLSTVGVYGDAGGAWVDEETQPAPLNERSRDRVIAEQRWLDLALDRSFTVAVFRLAGIYGPRRNALQKIADGTARRIVKPGQVFNRIHVEDIARTLMASMDRPHRGGIYNVADDEPGPPQDVIAFAAELLGQSPPPEVAFHEADMTPMARSFYQDSKRVRNTRIKQELGVSLLYPTYREGLQALAAAGEGAA